MQLDQHLSAFYASLQSRTLAKWKKIKKNKLSGSCSDTE
jgi:hypothetical protein